MIERGKEGREGGKGGRREGVSVTFGEVDPQVVQLISASELQENVIQPYHHKIRFFYESEALAIYNVEFRAR